MTCELNISDVNAAKSPMLKFTTAGFSEKFLSSSQLTNSKPPTLLKQMNVRTIAINPYIQ